MAVNFTNNWKNILDSLESVLKTEFRGVLDIKKGMEVPVGATQCIMLTPVSSSLAEKAHLNCETREFSINITFYFKEINLNEAALNHLTRYSTRLQALIAKNEKMTLTDGSEARHCRLETEEFSTYEETGANIVNWEFKCSHTFIVNS